MGKRVLVIVGHPRADSFCAALADHYAASARQAGAQVQMIRLGQLEFDPVLHQGYRESQPLEPDLQAAQQAITWAEHLVFVYPIWWGAMPALMKGFIDRVFLPGFAFRYRKDSMFWDKLLVGRSAHLIVTMDTPPWYFRWIYRMPGHHQLKKTILEFCGITPVRVSSFGPVRGAPMAKLERWIRQVQQFGSRVNA